MAERTPTTPRFTILCDNPQTQDLASTMAGFGRYASVDSALRVVALIETEGTCVGPHRVEPIASKDKK